MLFLRALIPYQNVKNFSDPPKWIRTGTLEILSGFQKFWPNFFLRAHSSLRLSRSLNRSCDTDTLVGAGSVSGAGGRGADCRDQLDDFRAAFDQLLRRHNFHRVPGLADFFFYWPQQQSQAECSLSQMNLPGLEDYVQSNEEGGGERGSLKVYRLVRC